MTVDKREGMVSSIWTAGGLFFCSITTAEHWILNRRTIGTASGRTAEEAREKAIRNVGDITIVSPPTRNKTDLIEAMKQCESALESLTLAMQSTRFQPPTQHDLFI